MLPIAKYGFELSMQHFWGSISLRYGWDISKFPTCPCGSKFDIQHSMSCKKGGFATIRHNKKWDLIVKVLSEVSNNTKIEPKLVPLCGENWSNRTANRSNEVRLDVETHGFWERGEEAFSDLRVFDPNACRYLNKLLQQCQVINENEKKRVYNEKVLQVDLGTLMPLVFSIYGSMSRECCKFYFRLSDLLSEKRNLSNSVVANWVRSIVCFTLLESIHLCLRGSWIVCQKASQPE